MPRNHQIGGLFSHSRASLEVAGRVPQPADCPEPPTRPARRPKSTDPAGQDAVSPRRTSPCCPTGAGLGRVPSGSDVLLSTSMEWTICTGFHAPAPLPSWSLLLDCQSSQPSCLLLARVFFGEQPINPSSNTSLRWLDGCPSPSPLGEYFPFSSTAQARQTGRAESKARPWGLDAMGRARSTQS